METQKPGEYTWKRGEQSPHLSAAFLWSIWEHQSNTSTQKHRQPCSLIANRKQFLFTSDSSQSRLTILSVFTRLTQKSVSLMTNIWSRGQKPETSSQQICISGSRGAAVTAQSDNNKWECFITVYPQVDDILGSFLQKNRLFVAAERLQQKLPVVYRV